MTPEQMYLKIAELKGWRRETLPTRLGTEYYYQWYSPDGKKSDSPSLWLTDANAALELLKEREKSFISWESGKWVVRDYDGDFVISNPDPCLAICEAWLIEHGVKVEGE